MATRLSPDEKRRRRMERLRLIAFLRRGGRLVREDLPAGAVAWCRCSRSGHPFSDRAVQRLLKRGCVVNGEPLVVIKIGERHLEMKGLGAAE